ncbi:uncharacterized protein LOC124896882 [Capsicum annuum]|uniref:uncharacterized protein LOC124896882 n=1 Tax=Capsicum annuum TaxID=4072 RepID=UPI001FB04EAE|nr:uncharacterized protein LOC124896882 [Capsicum annuum]
MNPLQYIFQKPMSIGNLTKWQILLREFDIVYVTQKAVKGQALTDHLVENPADEEYKPLKTYFPNEEVLFIGEDISKEYLGWRMFFDGPANFKGVGIGAVPVSKLGQHYPISAKLRFPCINNMAEYKASNLDLTMAADMNIQELLVIGDSDLVIHQVQGEWSVKNVKLLPYLECVKELRKKFIKVEFKHVPRIQNELANTLATLSSMIQHPDKNFIDPIKVNVQDQPAYCFYVDEHLDGKPWYYASKENSRFRIVKVRRRSEGNQIAFVLCGNVISVRFMVEASLYKSVTKKVVTDFLRNNIICRFGVPESIITENGANLNNGLMHEICEKFKITHHNSTPYHPQMNRVVEAANKNIKQILQKMIDNYKHWHENLSFALLEYRTTIRTYTGETPYLLVYGTEVVLPTEVEISSLRIIQEAKLNHAQWIQNQYEQLMLIDEKRMNAVFHGQLYQNRVAKDFNKKNEAKGKFAPNWQGPYIVHKVLTGVALILEELDGEVWPKAINADAVKRYYI